MEHHKISKLLKNSTIAKFVAIKWIKVNDLSVGQYSVNKNIKLKTPLLRSDLWDYSNAYIVVKWKTNVRATANNYLDQKDAILRNNIPFRSCKINISNTLIDKVKDLDIVMPMYNLVGN